MVPLTERRLSVAYIQVNAVTALCRHFTVLFFGTILQKCYQPNIGKYISLYYYYYYCYYVVLVNL